MKINETKPMPYKRKGLIKMTLKELILKKLEGKLRTDVNRTGCLIVIKEVLSEIEKDFVSKEEHDKIRSNLKRISKVDMLTILQYIHEVEELKQQLTNSIKIEDVKPYEPKKRWLEFIDKSIEGNKTKIFEVWNKETDRLLGDIKWHTGWRQYVFDDAEIFMAEGLSLNL